MKEKNIPTISICTYVQDAHVWASAEIPLKFSNFSSCDRSQCIVCIYLFVLFNGISTPTEAASAKTVTSAVKWKLIIYNTTFLILVSNVIFAQY